MKQPAILLIEELVEKYKELIEMSSHSEERHAINREYTDAIIEQSRRREYKILIIHLQKILNRLL